MLKFGGIFAVKIMENGIVRGMTAEEEAAFYEAREGQPDSPDMRVNDEAALTRYANELTGANDHDLISAAETLITERIKEE